MSKIRFAAVSEVETPPSGKVFLFVDIADGKIKQKDSSGVVIDLTQSGGSSVGTFLDLSDTPIDYTSAAGKLLVVNSTASGIEFIDSNITTSASGITYANTEDYYDGVNVQDVLDEIGETRLVSGYDLTEPTSLPDISFVNGTRTFSAAVKGGESNFYFWVNNHKHIKTTTQSVVIPDTTDTYYIYFDNSGVLQYVNNAGVTAPVFYENAITGLVYWNATAGTSIVGDERHGKLMDGRTHHFNHATFGARYESGLDIIGLQDGEADYTNTTSGFFWDEDIRHTLASQTTHPFIYKLGAAGEWVGTTPDSLVGFDNGTANIVWNEWTGTVWQLTEGGANTDYIIYFMIATPDISGYNVKKIIGQNGYQNRAEARAAIEDELNNIITEGLPSPEFIFLNAYIVRRNGDLEDLADGSTHVDLRASKGGSSSSSSSSSIAADVTTSITNFNTHLSATDTDVQTALETLDDHEHTASQVTDFDTEVGNNSVVSANTSKVTNATHTGEVTGATALTIVDNIIDESNLKLDSSIILSTIVKAVAPVTSPV